LIRRLPIRWRLTLWYAGLLLCTLVVFAGGVYFGLSTVLYDNFAEQVRQDARLAQAGVSAANGTVSLDPATISSFQQHEQFLRVATADGTLVVDTSDPEDRLAAIQAPTDASSDFQLLRIRGATFGIATVPIVFNGQTIGLVQVGESRSDVDETLRLIGLGFAVALPLLLLIAVVGGYGISARALAPVDAITSMAASIQADDLGSRLHLDLPDDELGRLAQTLNAMLARIDIAFARQRQFTGDAAHELRTPLSLIRGQVDVTLSRQRSTDEYERALTSIRGDAERLTALVSTLLTLARADTGTLPVSLERFDIGEIIGQVLASYGPQAQQRHVTLLDQSAPLWVRADEDLVVQVLVNLVDNALAHTPAGGVIGVVAAPEQGRPCLWVEDSGVGIAPEAIDHIFERFYRVDPGRARAQGGVGLGLAFCRAIADAHGGTIEVTSNPRQGSRFVFCLPPWATDSAD
jgi:heavy metal sensor kinase